MEHKFFFMSVAAARATVVFLVATAAQRAAPPWALPAAWLGVGLRVWWRGRARRRRGLRPWVTPAWATGVALALPWLLTLRVLHTAGWAAQGFAAQELGQSLITAALWHVFASGCTRPQPLGARRGGAWICAGVAAVVTCAPMHRPQPIEGLGAVLGLDAAWAQSPPLADDALMRLAEGHAQGSVSHGFALAAAVSSLGCDLPTLRGLCPPRARRAGLLGTLRPDPPAWAQAVAWGETLCAAALAGLPEQGAEALARTMAPSPTAATAGARLQGDLRAEAGDMIRASAAYQAAGPLGAAAWGWAQNLRGLGGEPPARAFAAAATNWPLGPSYVGATLRGVPGTLVWSPTGPGGQGSWIVRSRYRTLAELVLPIAKATPWPQRLIFKLRAGPSLRVTLVGSAGVQVFACAAPGDAARTDVLPAAACSLHWAEVEIFPAAQPGKLSQVVLSGELALASMSVLPAAPGALAPDLAPSP